MAIMPTFLKDLVMDKCTLCEKPITECLCGITKPLPLTEINTNLGYPLCPNCQDSVEYCIY